MTGWLTCSAVSDRDLPSPGWPFSNPCWPSRFQMNFFSTRKLRTNHVLRFSSRFWYNERTTNNPQLYVEQHDQQHCRFATPKSWVPRNRLTVSPPPTVGRPAPPGWLNTLHPCRLLLCLVPYYYFLATFSFSLPLLKPPLSSSNRPLPWRVNHART